MDGAGAQGAVRPIPAAARWPYPLMSAASPSGLTQASADCMLELGVELRVFADGASALVSVTEEDPAALLIPTDMEGVDLLRFVQVVVAKSDAPIIVGSGVDPESHRLAYQALDAGARTLIAAPFSPEQLALTIQQVDLRYRASAALAHGPVTVDRDRHVVFVAGTPRYCGPREFLLLEHLLKVAPRVASVEEIAVIIGQQAHAVNAARVRRCVQRLRRTLDAGRIGQPSLIENIHGSGYRLSMTAIEKAG
jgi:DNA-binding response OmpR family regulator